jgi:Tripartite tricarboxylate transporter family receptor
MMKRIGPALAALMIGAGASAADYPTKPINLIVPFAAGGSNDIVARAIGKGLADAWGQSVLIDNRAGAGGVIGAEAAARAPNDGHTILLVSSTFTINQAIRKRLPYDTLKDFSAVAFVAQSPLLVTAAPKLPASSVKELIELAKTKTVTYASSGLGSINQVAAELIAGATRRLTLLMLNVAIFISRTAATRISPSRAPSVGSLRISLTAARRCPVEKNECQGIAGLCHRVAALAGYLAGDAACIFRNHFAEAVALDGNLLSGFDFVVELDEVLDQPPLGCENWERTVADKDTHVLACATHWPGKHAVMLEDIHCPFHEKRDHLEVQDARSADLRRKGRNAHVDERVVQDTRIHVVIEDLADGVEFRHRPDLGNIHSGDIECGDIESGCSGMEIDRGVGVPPQQPVEQEPGVSARRSRTVLVPGPFPIHVDQVSASTRIGPPALHAFHGRAGHVCHRHHRARHLRRIELVHHGLDRMH